MLEKYYGNTRHIIEKIPLNSIMFRIYPSEKSLQYINVILMRNGNYKTKAHWREEKYYTYEDVVGITSSVVNDIFRKINAHGSDILISGTPVELMTRQNAKLSEINLSVLYRNSVTESGFEHLKKQLDDYQQANFIDTKLDDGSILELYFKKGMYQFDASRIEKYIDLNNYYEHLTNGAIRQKWYNLFEKTHVTKIQHRFSDIKFETVGIKEKEFPIYYRLLTTLFYLFEKRLKTSSDLVVQKVVKKKLKNLKEQDPILYDFKKIYKSKEVYSKICQKPYQPELLSKKKYDDLSKDKKDKAVKYWNFTTKEDVYYSCPNPKFPYIKFIVKKHPSDFCIPCCKKTSISEIKNDPKKIIYDMCMEKHEYKKEKKNIIQGSRYIMTYGKDIEAGRLSRLPETTLEHLFYDTYSDKHHGIDPECVTADGYYLYGVAQNTASLNGVGYLFSLSHALDVDIKDLLIKMSMNIQNDSRTFYSLLNGSIINYFDKTEDLSGALLTISNDKVLDFIGYEDVP